MERKNSASHLYIIRLKNEKIRNLLFEKLKSYGIGSQVHYIPAYKFKIFENKNYEIKLKNTEKHFKTCLSIPCFFKLDKKKIEYIAKTINLLTSKK